MHGHVIDKPIDPGKNRQHLIGHRHGFVLLLFQQFDHPRPARQLGLCGLVQLAAELGERGHFPILR